MNKIIVIANFLFERIDIMKKLLTFTAALVAILALCTISVFAAEGNAVAKIGNDGYATIEAAFDAAVTGDTIVLQSDCVASKLLGVKSGVEITLDLNGKTITAVAGRGNVVWVYDGGKLTIEDETNEGGIVNGNALGYAICNLGTLIVNGGNYSGQYALYNGSYSSATATATLNGGTFKPNEHESTYSVANCSNMVVNGADIKNLLATSANFEMKSGTIEILYANAPDTTIASGTSTVITGGTIGTLAATESNPVSVSENANITELDTSLVAKIGNVYYASLQDAFNTCKNGETVTLISDIELTESLTVPKASSVVLDMAGYTISQSKECAESYQMIANNGTLYITDSVGGGKLSFTDTSAGDPSFGWGSYTIRNQGTLTVENVTVENLSTQNAAGNGIVHMYCAIFQYSGSCTINSGVISTPSYRSVRLWKGEMVINGGSFEGQVWVQCVDNTSSLTVNDGSFAPRGVDGSSVFVSNSANEVDFSVTGGSFETKIGCSDASALAGTITGGTFTEAAINAMGVSSALFANELIQDENGNYTVAVALESVFTFLGYSVNSEYTSITAGYTVDQEALALWIEQNDVSGFDFGCIFGTNGNIADKSATSFAKYTEYQTFNVKIKGISIANEAHITTPLSLALYIERGNGKEYVVEINDKIQIVSADKVPTVIYSDFIE